MFEDQIGNIIQLEKAPTRIISLVPSQTELLYHLGLGKKVVGITKFCIHPEEWYRTKNRVGGPKSIDLQKIAELQPDLIIGNKEENIKDQIEEAEKIAPVWLSDIYNLADSLKMIAEISTICDKKTEGEAIIAQIQQNFQTLTPFREQPRVLYLIWRKPFMGVATHTFIDFILTKELGVKNALEAQKRYPELDLNNLPEADYVFLSTEPYPFQEKHFPEVQKLFPKAKILLVDGEYFTWYGSRLIGTPQYLKSVMERM